MKTKCIVISVVAVMVVWPIGAYGYEKDQSGFGFDGLIKSVEVFDEGGEFCQSLDGGYVFRTSELIAIPLDHKPVSNSSTVTIFKWENGAWQKYGIRKATVSGGQLDIGSRVSEGGLYQLEFEMSYKQCTRYVFVCDGWKRVVFGFCREMKNYLEINSDAGLLRSTIGVSHFDNVMEVAARAEEFSDRLFNALRDAIKAKDDFDDGKIPDFVTPGLTKIRFKRFKADDVSEFIISTPEGYAGYKKYPLVARIDPYNVLSDYNLGQKEWICLWWHFDPEVYCYWKDFDYFFKLINEKLAINSDRVYIHSICGNSRFAMAIALKHPDIWAGCMMSSGYNCIELAGNIFNAKFFFANIHPEIKACEPRVNFVTRLYHYFGCDDFKYVPVKDVAKSNITDFIKLKSRKNPDRVYFKTRSYQSNMSYWLSIEGCGDDNFYRTIEAEIKENKIFVTTENTDAYKIYLSKAPIERSKAVEIIENNKSLGFCDEDVFVRASDRYTNAEMVKTPQIAGPIEDAFSESHIIVYQSQHSEPNYLEAVAEFAGGISPLAKCIKDTDFDERYIEAYNIIFVGRDFDNPTILEIFKKLPVSITTDSIVADGKKYEAENADCIMIYPNPLNRSKYVLLFAPSCESAVNSMGKVFADVKSEKDVVIFETDENKDVKYHVRENFDSLWRWSENAGLVVFDNNFKSSAVDFQKLISKAVKDYLKADISIVDCVFTAEGHVPSDEKVVLRDLFANMQNHWIIKIKIKGGLLKQLVNKLFVGDACDRKTTYGLSGMSFNAGSVNDGLLFSEIVSDMDYTIALSARSVKSMLLGYVLTDYEILDEVALLKLLKDYSQKTGPMGLDQKFENIKIF